MALLNTIDPADAGQRLERWLAATIPAEHVAVSQVEVPQSAGFSMTTILFRATWEAEGEPTTADLVARVAPTGLALFERPDLAREFKVLRALGDHTAAPVPSVRWLEPDASVLGAPFLVMDRAFGQVPSDDPPYPVAGWVAELDAADRAKLYPETLRAMAEVHCTDWRALDLACLTDDAEKDEPGAAQQMALLERTYDWVHGGERSPTIDSALAILAQRLPPTGDLVLNWGDSRIGNVVFDSETHTVAALLDWEMATIASPEMDLGWFLFFARYYTEGIGVEKLPGLQSRDELIAQYEALTGRDVEHIDFYEGFAAARASVLIMRVGRLMIEAGALPADSPMPLSNPASQLLAKLLELPAPQGQASSFVGNR